MQGMVVRNMQLKQRHGSLLAAPHGERTKRAVGAAPVPVLRDCDDGAFHWAAKPPAVLWTPDTPPGVGPWWMENRHAAWRAALVDGAAASVRAYRNDGTANGSVGASKGVWRMADVIVAPDRISMRLVDRIGYTEN